MSVRSINFYPEDYGSYICYNTYDNWDLILTALTLSPPVLKSSFVSVPGRDGDLDLSTALTDVEPRYENRTLTATFETSASTRDYRNTRLNSCLNTLSGRRWRIQLPDDTAYRLLGRVSVQINYSDLAHASLTITAICDPWRRNANSWSTSYTASATERSYTLRNNGYRAEAPEITVTGSGASVTVRYDTSSLALSPGTYTLPIVILGNSTATVYISGTGSGNIYVPREIL